MSFFGMGAWEISIILIAALVIFGPNRLPEIAGKVGKTVRDLRQMSADLTGEFERNAGVQDLKKAVQGELSGIKSQVDSVSSGVKKDLNAAGKTATSAVSSATKSSTSSTSNVTTAKTATTAAKSTTSTKPAAPPPPPKASKKDPLADVSFLQEIAVPKPSTVKPHVVAAAPSASPNGTAVGEKASNGSADQVDALTRARQRRLAAGYNRRPE